MQRCQALTLTFGAPRGAELGGVLAGRPGAASEEELVWGSPAIKHHLTLVFGTDRTHLTQQQRRETEGKFGVVVTKYIEMSKT